MFGSLFGVAVRVLRIALHERTAFVRHGYW
jgi:hypothetical protein